VKYLNPWYRLPASQFDLPTLIAYRDHFIKSAGRTVTRTVTEDGQTVERTERLPPARGYVNDAVNRVRAAFRWAANRGLIEARVAHELSVLTPLTRGQAEGARETEGVPPVPDDVFYATLDLMPRMPADILRILRISVARAGEVCAM
jgi:integrase